MAHIKIITDSASDIPQYLVDKYNIGYLPICVVIDGKVYYDRYDLDGREYMKKLPDMEEIPTTSMVPLEIMEKEFRNNLDNYDYQIFVTMSAKASGGNNAAHLLKEQIEDELGHESNIIVLDSEKYSMLFGKDVLKMAELAAKEASLEEVMSAFENGKKTGDAFFTLDDLKHLQKGGRIKATTALIGGMLGIKPILTISDGLVENIGKERGMQKSLNKIVNMTAEVYDTQNKPKIWLANGYADESCEITTRLLKEKLGDVEIEMFDLGCIIGTHTGPGVIGIIFDKRGE
ncbi:MAG: DegV family protein [Clostridia bacterium]|nr:DegV family protein [Clostridia bacterium]